MLTNGYKIYFKNDAKKWSKIDAQNRRYKSVKNDAKKSMKN
jgi:hypothetical protein